MVPIYRAEIALLIGPVIPDRDAVILQISNIGIALQKPQQLVNNGFEVAFLGGDQRKAFGQVKAHLMGKDAIGTGAGAVTFKGAVVTHMAHQIKILFHV